MPVVGSTGRHMVPVLHTSAFDGGRSDYRYAMLFYSASLSYIAPVLYAGDARILYLSSMFHMLC